VQGAGFLNTLGAVRLAKFYATGQIGETIPTQAIWSKHIIWGNHMLGGGVPLPTANAFSLGTNWGVAKTDDNQNIVWGTACSDAGCSNIVWGTDATPDQNIVWGTACSDAGCSNIVWGTDDANIVWGTDCGGGDCSNIVWGTVDANIVWGTADEGNIVWGTSTTGSVQLVDWNWVLTYLSDAQVFDTILSMTQPPATPPPPTAPTAPSPDPASTSPGTTTPPTSGTAGGF
jgi:hypothetical protein